MRGAPILRREEDCRCKKVRFRQVFRVLSFAEGHLRKAVGDDQMPFSFDELLNWARSLVMVIDHRIKTPETMEVLKS